MKNFLFMLGAVAFITACNDDSGNGGSINYEEGYKYLTSLNVSDAKMIYQKTSGGTRAVSDEHYYKLDLSGNEVKLSIKGEDSLDHNIRISKVVKLSDKIILVNPVEQDVLDLFYKPGPNDEHIFVGVGTTTYLSIVDVETERLYRWPREISIDMYHGTLKSQQDNKGNVYFASASFLYNQIYKLDISDFTIRPVLPDGVEFRDFYVTENGFIAYWNDMSENSNCRIKCPGGRIYPVQDNRVFIFDGNLYSVRDNQIIQYETVGSNDVREKVLCEITEDTDYVDATSFVPNYVRNTMLINNVYEFDGEQCVKLKNPVTIGDISTSKAWYTHSNNTFRKTFMENYEESEFRVADYEMQSILASPESPNITFTGFSYSNGANVVGTITASDEIIIDQISDNGEKIINLIPLN